MYLMSNNARLKISKKHYKINQIKDFEIVLFKLLKRYNKIELYTTHQQKINIKCWKTPKPHADNLLWWEIENETETEEGDCLQTITEVLLNLNDLLHFEEEIRLIKINPNNNYNKHFKECLKNNNN